MAKAIFNLPTTRHLMDRLQVDQALRQFCGWRSPGALPHESRFSRAFGEFCKSFTQTPRKFNPIYISLLQRFF